MNTARETYQWPGTFDVSYMIRRHAGAVNECTFKGVLGCLRGEYRGITMDLEEGDVRALAHHRVSHHVRKNRREIA